MRLSFFTLFVAIFLSAVLAHAEPRVSLVSGEVSHGERVVVQGRGFGNKSVAGPTIFETVEGGRFSSRWTGTGDLTPSKNIQRHHHSRHHAHLNLHQGATDGSFSLTNRSSRSWFLAYWFRLERNWNWGTTDKTGNDRFLSWVHMAHLRDRKNVGEDVQIVLDSVGGRIALVGAGLTTEEGVTLSTGVRGSLTPRRWHHFQMEFLESTQASFDDGRLRLWLDGKLMADKDSLITRKSLVDEKIPTVIGLSDAWGPNTLTGERDDPLNELYVDDVYVDVSLARVELGDRPLYSDCTHRELQPVAEWSSQRLEFSVNQGSFKDGTPVFLFIHDADGEVNENGIPLSMGDDAEKVKSLVGPRYLVTETKQISLQRQTKAEFGASAFEVRIYDAAGNLVVEDYKTGRERLVWDGKDEGAAVRPGVYLCKITGLWSDVAYHSIEVSP